MTKPAPRERILVVDDVPANLDLLSDALESAGYDVLAAQDGELALSIATRALPDLILLDVLMPKLDGFQTCRRLKANSATRPIPVIFLTAKDETPSVVEGFAAGGVDYVIKPFQMEEVLTRVRTHLQLHRLTRELSARNAELEAEIARRQRAETAWQEADHRLTQLTQQEAERCGLSGFIGDSPPFAAVLNEIRRVQQFPATNVLIVGESGTGKELAARAVHYGSSLAKGPFVAVNCSAVPAELMESAFFGHVKGAFTGASADRQGYFEQAAGGTLFLDEIGDMPLPLQAKLLRALEQGEITPVGGQESRKVQPRVLAATNADLRSAIETGRFRRDLYYRLARFTLHLPPLRERQGDIPLLAERFLARFAAEMGLRDPGFTPEALNQLAACEFPGNVRELKNVIERALILSDGQPITADGLALVPDLASEEPESAAAGGVGSKRVPENAEALILEHLRDHGSITNGECRKLLGIRMHQAWYLLRKLHRAGRLIQDHSRRWALYRLTSGLHPDDRRAVEKEEMPAGATSG